MAAASDPAAMDPAASAEVHDTESTLSSPPTRSSVDENEPSKERSANEDSFTSRDYQPATADGQYRDSSDAQDDEETIDSSELIQEIRRLREKVSKIEKRANKRPNYLILEAEWRVAREKVGIDGEQSFWKRFMENRKDIAGALVKLDISQLYTLNLDDLAREMDEDPVYENDVLRWRKNWERKLSPSKMWSHGTSRYDDLFMQDKVRFASIRQEQLGKPSLEDSDTDGSLDFELNLDRLRYRYLRKVDRFHEERDVRRMQSQLEARQRQEEKEKLAKQLLEARSEHEAPSEKASSAASVDFQLAEGTAEEPLQQPTHAFPKLNRVDWVGFNALRNVPEEQSFVIDVLLGEPEISFGFSPRANRRRNAKRDSERSEVAQEVNVNVKQPAVLTGQSPLPERIRIHSTQLIRILDKVHGESVGSDGPLIIIRPFRILIHYDEALRRWHRKLEKKFATADDSMTDSDGMRKGT